MYTDGRYVNPAVHMHLSLLLIQVEGQPAGIPALLLYSVARGGRRSGSGCALP